MQKQEKRCIFGIFCLSKEIYEIEQANNRYVHTVDTVSNHLIITDPLHIFLLKNMVSYMVAVVRAIYSNLVKTHLMTYSLCFCGFLVLIHIQITLAN